MSNDNQAYHTKMLASLISTIAATRGVQNLAVFEQAGIGLQTRNINKMYKHFNFSGSFIMMSVSFAIFLGLGLTVNYLSPSQLDIRKSFRFCFT